MYQVIELSVVKTEVKTEVKTCEEQTRCCGLVKKVKQ